VCVATACPRQLFSTAGRVVVGPYMSCICHVNVTNVYSDRVMRYFRMANATHRPVSSRT
jgi:hypothetical protein